MSVAPLLLSSAASLYAGSAQAAAYKYNAAAMQNEANASTNQGAAATSQVLRQGIEQRGKQIAAFGGAGVGYGGSSYTALRTSAINNELDALNTKYKSAFTAYGYGVQSALFKQEGNQALTSGWLLAGAKALQTLNGDYTSSGSMGGGGSSGGGN